MNIGVIYAVASAASYALYAIGLKPFKQRIILFYWVNIIVYMAYLILFYVKNVILQHDKHPIQHLLHDFTFTNVPFYLLMACLWVGSIIILDHLLDRYDISLVMPVTEVSILFILVGYIGLGAPFNAISLTSVLVVFLGAVISAFDKLSLNNPLGPLKRIPHALIIGGVLESFLSAASKWITFLCTHETAATLGIHHWINNIFLHIYQIPFSFHNPFYYNVGVRFFIVIVFTGYIVFVKDLKEELFITLKEHFMYILGVSVAFAVSVVTYHAAFFELADKNVLTALGKVSIPFILIIGNIMLKEKITRPKIIGCAIILLGGLISLLA